MKTTVVFLTLLLGVSEAFLFDLFGGGAGAGACCGGNLGAVAQDAGFGQGYGYQAGYQPQVGYGAQPGYVRPAAVRNVQYIIRKKYYRPVIERTTVEEVPQAAHSAGYAQPAASYSAPAASGAYSAPAAVAEVGIPAVAEPAAGEVFQASGYANAAPAAPAVYSAPAAGHYFQLVRAH